MVDSPSEGVDGEAAPATGFTSPTLRPIRVGARVTSTNPAPVFASDPQVGDRGTVQETSGDDGSASYLVRWDGGSESWSKREHLKPSGRGSLLPSPGAPAAGPASAPAPSAPAPDGATPPNRRARPPMGSGARTFQRFLPLVFILFAGQGLIRALVRSAHHPSTNTALLALVVVAVVGLAVNRVVRRGGSSRNRRPRGPGGGA